jgi:dTDP-4-dehydrorhamnose 3,5-epimerase
MKIAATPLAGVFEVASQTSSDVRGAFARWFCERELSELLGARKIVQINHSRTTAVGAVRGMHYQRAPHAEMKMIRCIRGRVWDVAVDLRGDSQTFLQWHAVELTPAEGRMLVVPEGCAHGFQALEADSELLYLHTAFYEPSSEGGVDCRDPRIAIRWPLPVTGLSPRDETHPQLAADFQGIAT